MKNFILSMILTIALIALVSYIDYRPAEKTNGGGYGTKHKGESELIIPGDGKEMANTIIEPGSIQEQAVAYKNATTETVTKETEETSEVISEVIKEEHNSMNDIVLSFWHGVATVLIGETVALMVAVAWMKIRGGK